MNLSLWPGVLVDRLAFCRALALLTSRADKGQRYHTDLLRMLDDLYVDLTLVLHFSGFRMTAVSPTSSTLLIYHFVSSLWLFQPLLIYRR